MGPQLRVRRVRTAMRSRRIKRRMVETHGYAVAKVGEIASTCQAPAGKGVGMAITKEVLDALPEAGGIGQAELPALALFSNADDPIDVIGGDGRRYMVGWAGGIRYKRALPAYWPIRLGAHR
jgi:hypothetical protein